MQRSRPTPILAHIRILLTAVGLTLAPTSGRTQSPDEPAIRFTAPVEKQKLSRSSGDKLKIRGEVVVGEGQWRPAPGVCLLVISRDKAQKEVVLAKGLELKSLAEASHFEFTYECDLSWKEPKRRRNTQTYYATITIYKAASPAETTTKVKSARSKEQVFNVAD